MTPAEKKDLALFDAPARRRVAADVGATTNQVDDCIARYLWTRQLTQ
jgi:signal recognition particle GTPase